MTTRLVNPRNTPGVSRRELLHAGLAAGAALSAWPLYDPPALWSGDVGTPKHGGTLRVRGWDPPHFDPHMSTTMQGKFEGMVRSPFGIAWEPDAPLYRTFAADSSWNAGHLNDPKLTEMLKEQRRTKDIEARRKIIYDTQRYAAEQQDFVYLNLNVITASWGPYVRNYGPNITFDYGSRAAVLWLDR